MAMNDKDEKALYERALAMKGEDSQLNIFLEECAEAIHSVCKYKRIEEKMYEKHILKENIANELADLTIMIRQLLYTLDIESKFTDIKEQKLLRLKMRLDLSTSK